MKRMKHSKKSLAIVLMLTLMGIGTVPGTMHTAYADSRGVVEVSALNLRNAASISSGIVGVLGKGTEVVITDTQGDWYKVRTTVGGKEKTGYVFSSYVNAKGDTGSAGAVVSGNGTVNVNGLRIRKGASLNSGIIGSVNSGTRVTILGTEGDWYKVGLTMGGTYTTGYMYKAYVTISSSSDSNSQQTTAASGSGVVNTPVLNVRKQPSVSSARLGCIYQGSTVKITGISGDWYKITAKVNNRDTEGYVSAQYITKKTASDDNNTNNNTNGEAAADGKAKVNVSALNVRSKATTSSKVVTCLSKNTVVTLLGKSGDWYKISVESNGAKVNGYVFAEYVTKVSDSENGGSQQPSDTEQTVSKKYGIVNTAVLNLRAQASTSSKVIGALYKNGTVTIQSLTADGQWYKVETLANGKAVTGYAFAKYITLTDKAPEGEGDTGSNGSYTEEEVKLLAALVYCESGNQPYEGKLAVANVVLNRINSTQFPNTMKEVIYQRGQFTPAFSGSLAAALNKGVPDECVKAAKDAIAGNNNVEGYYFFNTVVDTSKVAEYIKIGDHIFYYY